MNAMEYAWDRLRPSCRCTWWLCIFVWTLMPSVFLLACLPLILHPSYRARTQPWWPRHESLGGTVPERALYLVALKATKRSSGSADIWLGVSKPAAYAATGVSAAIAA